MTGKTHIKMVPDAELAAWLAARGQPAFRHKQIQDWLYRRWALSFDQMHNLPLPLREQLAADFVCCSVAPCQTQEAQDGTLKILFALQDGEAIETVQLRAGTRTTACVSTQVGCPVRCMFCASGSQGLRRNLTAGEIVDQVVFLCAAQRQRIGNLVVMGMGEPLLNPEALIQALARLCAPSGLGFGDRHVTVSTSGIAPGILRLAAVRRQWQLALSLHATTDAARARLIPDPYRYPLHEVLGACREYQRASGRLVTFEYTLLCGQNDTDADMVRLAALAAELRAKVNLIAYNPTQAVFDGPGPEELARCRNRLQRLGVRCTVRRERGAEIRAACGQLRRRAGVGGSTVDSAELALEQ